MSNIDKKTENRIRRHDRIRAKVKGDANRPRLSVFRSNASIYLQLIDDLTGRTLASARLEELKAAGKMKPVEAAHELGKLIASKAFAQNIKLAVFDRGGNRYHGRIKAIADGARAGGLEF